ncbi:MAG: alpha/beta hydrolase [Pseudomonadota bacterium]
MTTSKMTTPQGRSIAFRKFVGTHAGPGFLWLSGFKSDMQGGKVLALEAWAKARGRSFLAFDYSGHGESNGDFAEGTISDWREDTLAVLDQLADGPQILVGSSMGGWMALLVAIARPDRVAGMILIAPAPDFTAKLMWPGLSTNAKAEIMEAGFHMQSSDYGEPVPITKALIEDGRQWQLLDAPIPFKGPVRILQGMKDPDVPWTHAEKLVDGITSSDLVFTLIKDGDHRLSRDQDIERLLSTCAEVANGFYSAASTDVTSGT